MDHRTPNSTQLDARGDGPGEALGLVGYLAFEDWTENLLQEIDSTYKRYDRLYLAPPNGSTSFWAQNIWLQPRLIPFSSIEGAANALRSWHKNWFPYGEHIYPQLGLIAKTIPALSARRKAFPFVVPAGPIGAFTLLDERTILASATTTSPFPGGILQFVENKKDPPSSAYLKLWEALSRMRKRPAPGDRCLDAGACPGGWTWVMTSFGAEVLALDRSPLDDRLMALPNVRFRPGNAFAVKPQNISDFGWDSLDWLVSDLICYPDKLFEWVCLWLESGKVSNYVITIKMQGAPDWQSIRAFAAIPGSLVYHGNYNKNELTWIYSAPPVQNRLP